MTFLEVPLCGSPKIAYLQHWVGEQQSVTGYLQGLGHWAGHRKILENLLGGLCFPGPALSGNENEVVIELRAHHAVSVVSYGVTGEGGEQRSWGQCYNATSLGSEMHQNRKTKCPASKIPLRDCALNSDIKPHHDPLTELTQCTRNQSCNSTRDKVKNVSRNENNF